MKDISDILTVSFDNGLKDESALCVSRKQDGDYSILKMELGEQADILHYLLTNQIAKAEIKTEKWIPVSERLPETDDYVLCCDKDGYMTVGYFRRNFLIRRLDGTTYYKNYWVFDDDEYDDDVIAWMPLPDPYKPKEDEE